MLDSNHDVIKAESLVTFDERKVNMSPMMEFMHAFFQIRIGTGNISVCQSHHQHGEGCGFLQKVVL